MKTVPSYISFFNVATRKREVTHVVPIRFPSDSVCLENRYKIFHLLPILLESCTIHTREHVGRGTLEGGPDYDFGEMGLIFVSSFSFVFVEVGCEGVCGLEMIFLPRVRTECPTPL